MMTNILFVDDELFILQSMKRTIRSKDVKVFIANSGEEGLKILSDHPIDIVVSDVRMPEMDGIEFLTEVHKLYPKVYRLILSGYVDKEAVLKAIASGVAIEYLTKPWDKDDLRAKINHIIDIKSKLTNDKITMLLNSISRLPRNASNISCIERAIDSGESVDKIADFISSDLSMATKILQLVNSALYASTKVSDLSKAIEIIGVENLKSILLTSTYLLEDKELSDWQKNEINRLMSEQLKVKTTFTHLYKERHGHDLPEDYTALGMIYNIGKVINASCFPQRHQQILETAKENKTDYYQAEILLGFEGETHQEIGAYFLELWNFSKVNIEASLFHHDAEKASEENIEALSLLEEATHKVRAEKKQEGETI